VAISWGWKPQGGCIVTFKPRQQLPTAFFEAIRLAQAAFDLAATSPDRPNGLLALENRPGMTIATALQTPCSPVTATLKRRPARSARLAWPMPGTARAACVKLFHFPGGRFPNQMPTSNLDTANRLRIIGHARPRFGRRAGALAPASVRVASSFLRSAGRYHGSSRLAWPGTPAANRRRN